jgi:hypothetical protein
LMELQPARHPLKLSTHVERPSPTSAAHRDW